MLKRLLPPNNLAIRQPSQDEDTTEPVLVKYRAAPSKILILQGPVGPFFSDLHKALLGNGISVQRVLFNAGDSFFDRGNNDSVRFTGSLLEWETWLRFELTQNTPDAIILFGSNRPAHEIARRIAGYLAVNVVSLEEGYLRSGYITCEVGGNNQHSPMTKWQPGGIARMDAALHATTHPIGGSSFKTMSFWGALYYFARDIFSKTSDEGLFHRRRERLLPLVYSWAVHLTRRAAARAYEVPIRRVMRLDPGYILVPLQVSTDSQLQTASRGWNTLKLVDACLQAVRQSGSHERVVFKLHPLERGGPAIKRLIMMRARQWGLASSCVKTICSGRLGDLAHNSSGMVVINSTSAFSALHHDVPVLVLGEAVYRHEGVVTVGNTLENVSDFFKLRHVKSHAVIDAFLTDLKMQSLLPGDFYTATGREVAVAGIIHKLKQFKTISRSQDVVNL